MRKTVLVLMALSLLAVAIAGCQTGDKAKLTVVTSTSLMEYIVQQVGGSHLDVVNLVPPNQHPGNFDVKPGDIEKLAKARLFLLHGWPGEGYADKLIESAANPNLTTEKANVNGNWMIPSVQAAAVDRVKDILSQIDSEYAATYSKNAEAYKTRIQKKEADLKARFEQAKVVDVGVIASFRQADFLAWAGFKVVATYNDPKSLTPQLVRELVDKGKAGNVSIVVNNVQDSQDAGKAIAEEIGAVNMNLSNFPGGFENTETWEKAIDRNTDILLKVITGTK